MRTITTAQEAALASGDPALWIRVRVADAGGTLHDLGDLFGLDWLSGASWGEDVDGRGQSADILIIRDRYNDSNAPWRSTRANNLSGAALLALNREIRIEAAVVPSASAPASGDWIEVFRGGIDSIDPAGPLIKVGCRDLIRSLQSTWIETEGIYGTAGGVAVETEMQDILDDAWADLTLPGSAPAIYTPTSPGWMVLEFVTEKQSLLDQLTVLSDQIGWQLRYRWHAGSAAFRLTFYTPDRTKATVDRTFTPDQWIDISTLSISIENIRNVCIVEWSDPSTTDSSGQPIRNTTTSVSAPSIASYGRQTIFIAEDAASNINTSTEATALAANCVSDLAEPTATMSVEALFFPFIELDDRYTFTADNARFDTDQTLTVVGYRHSVDQRQARTRMTLRGSVPSRGTQAWTEMGAYRGVGPIQTTHGPLASTPSVVEAAGGMRVVFPRSNLKIDRWEIHAGDVGFAPSVTDLSTVVGSGRGTAFSIPIDFDRMPVDTARDIVFIPIDKWGNRGAQQRVSNVRSRRAGTHLIDTPARVAGGFLGGFFGSQTRGAAYPPDRWSMSVGAWGTGALLDDGSTYAAPLTGEKALLLTGAGAVTLLSDALPVTPTRLYRAQAQLKADSTAPTVQIGAEWLDADQASLSSTQYIWNATPTASGKWLAASASLSPPSGARWVRFSVGKNSTSPTSVNVLVDRLLMEEEVNAGEDLTKTGRIFDDFAAADDYGDLKWTLYGLGADPITNPPTASKGTSTGWNQLGSVLIETQAIVDYGGLLTLGDVSTPPLFGSPPSGTDLRVRARLQGGTYTSVGAWIGLTDKDDTWPDAALSNTCSLIGFACRAAGAAANWFGIIRSGTSESSVDMGAAGGATWVTLGARKTAGGWQFSVNGVDVGSPVATTNEPTAGLTPCIGVITAAGAARQVEVDCYALAWRIER